MYSENLNIGNISKSDFLVKFLNGKYTVTIWKLDMSGIQMVHLCPKVNKSIVWMVMTILFQVYFSSG
jgi:hypothetical protein